MNPPETLREHLQRLPKVLLHDHLDGGLRLGTLLELLRQRGIEPPAADEAALGRWFDDRAHAGSLVEFLRGFALTVAAMASPAALRRVAREAAEDALAQGVVLAEFRIAPLLFEEHGLDGDTAVEALLAGLSDVALPSGLIVCAMRHLPEAETARAAELAARWAGRGVVAFDLAGAEAGHPPAEHSRALGVARDAGLGLTLHAGEADVAERVVEAARLGASRIGHGVRLADAIGDPARQALVDEVIARGVHLEVCPTSNVHTGAAASIASHPIRPLWDAGVSLSWHPDNTLMSRTTMTDEAAALVNEAGFRSADLLRMGLQAARASFVRRGLRLRAPRADDFDWVVRRHGALYAQEWGYDGRFEALVGSIVADYRRRLDPAREACWIAEADGERLGCIFLVQARDAGTGAPIEGTGQLRLLLVEPKARGRGLGRQLTAECERFAAACGYRRLHLWTQSELKAARAIYARRGWQRCGTEGHENFGKALESEVWELALPDQSRL